MKKFRWELVWPALSLLLFFGPPLLFACVIVPYAATTLDPDRIEVLAWFGGLLVMLIGIVCGLVSLALLLKRRNDRSAKLAISSLDIREKE